MQDREDARSPGASGRNASWHVRSRLLGERIDAKNLVIAGFEEIGQTPRILEDSNGARIAIFRFGAVVAAVADGALTDDVPADIGRFVANPFEQIESESVSVVIAEPTDNRLKQDTRLVMADFSTERFSILADVLAKSVALARDEQRIHATFEKLEPFAQALARSGGLALGPSSSLKLLGEALLAQHRMVGRVEVHEKPDILWERPDLVRLHQRLEEEYDLTERARELGRKLKVIEETARAIADVADAHISRRLEIAIVVLILFEIVLSLTGFFGGH